MMGVKGFMMADGSSVMLYIQRSKSSAFNVYYIKFTPARAKVVLQCSRRDGTGVACNFPAMASAVIARTPSFVRNLTINHYMSLFRTLQLYR
jgi:hypothetical protein